MAKKQKNPAGFFQTAAVRLTRVHFIYITCFLVSVVIFDASNLYSHQAIAQMWTVGGVMVAIVALIWFAARFKAPSHWYYIGAIAAIILADIFFASYFVWRQRGLYSKAVMLYTVPIITAAAARSRSILLATTTLSAAAYSTISVRYFFQNYGLGYRVELWGTVAFFSAMMFVLALLLMIITRPTEEKF